MVKKDSKKQKSTQSKSKSTSKKTTAKTSKKATPVKAKVTKKQVKQTAKAVENTQVVKPEIKKVETKIVETPKSQGFDFWKFWGENGKKLTYVVLGVVFMSMVVYGAFVVFPDYIRNAEDIAEYEQEKEREKSEEEENQFFNGNYDRDVVMKTNFGDIEIDLIPNSAPSTVESFLRHSYRDYYNETKFHRMVDMEDFVVIQGGDPNSRDDNPDNDGVGGESAFGTNLPDELWEIKPEFNNQNIGEIINEPKFREPSLYADLNKERGTVVYQKGLIIMAKGASADSAGSQFFITLEDTILPAQYTAFGRVKDVSTEVLDKIKNEVEPVSNEEKTLEANAENQDVPVTDGRPSVDIIINSIDIK